MTFPGGLIAIAFIQFFVCIMLPVFYLIYYVFKKDFNPLIMLIGLVAFVIFGLIATKLLTKFFAPASAIGAITTANYAVRYSLCTGVIKALGIWVALLILSKRYVTTIVPASFALGYSLIDMFFYKSAYSFFTFTNGMTINRNGFEETVAAVDLAKQDAFRESMAELAATPASFYIWRTADAVCAFAATVCIARLLWYSIEGGKSEKSWTFIPVCVVIAVVLELPGALYDGGAFSGYAPAGIAYYVLTVLLVVGTILIARRHDEKAVVSDSHLPLHRR